MQGLDCHTEEFTNQQHCLKFPHWASGVSGREAQEHQIE
jgi:hypothetical protein